MSWARSKNWKPCAKERSKPCLRHQAFFVSDLHIGAEFNGVFPDREIHLCRFLDTLKTNASHLFILGDLFEFWMEYRFYIAKSHFKLLMKLRELTDSGVEVHYLSGNHDFNLGQFFQQELGVQTHHHPFSLTLQNKRLLLLHGDGMAANDGMYRRIKKILVHPAANWAFKSIHPDWGMALAQWVGARSRKNHQPSNPGQYRKAAQKLFMKHHPDLLIHGHTHFHFVQTLEEGVYANSGEWVQKLQYLKLEDGICTAHSYTPEESFTGH